MSNKTFKKPDLKAPRFRKEVYNILNPEFFKSFKTKYPKYSNISDTDIKNIVKKFNVLFWETVIDKRDGVQFPEGLGYLFIGTCQTSKKSNVDFGKSNKYGVTVTNNNWGTDGKLAKIFYTNYASKYKFTNRECWAFIGCRNFKRTVARTYPENWTIYVQVDPMKKIRKIFQSTVLKSMTKKIEDRKLENYNEFDL